MQITANNPIFGESAARDYQDKYFNAAIMPMLDAARIQNKLTGNQNSTFGATLLGKLGVQGSNQAFFAGEDFRNRRVSELLNRRQSFFGNEARIVQEQNALGIQRDLGIENELTSRYGMNSQFNLGAANLLSGQYQYQDGQDRADARAQAQARAQGVAGLFGLGGGLIGGALGGGNFGSMFGGAGGYTAPPTPNFPFPKSSFANFTDY